MRSLTSHIKLPALTVVALAVAYSMVFFYAPIEADQGFVQKIFYLHVPLAIVTLCGLIAGGVNAGLYLRTGRSEWDARSYVAVHVSLILGVGALVTGSIWAKASWGHWWVWQEPTLVSFLIVLLLFCCYMPLRFAIEDPERQARFAAVFAVMGGAFIPVNFVVVRMASAFTHPRVFQVTGAQLPLSMGLTFVAALIAIGLLFVTLCRFELRAKALRVRIRSLERAVLDPEEAPDPPLPKRSTPRCPPSRLEQPASTSRLRTSSF
ncbi:MAG TPA: cytochrome c biogenesis protein CcsA [Solirubrobacteraceae bacterium]|nr:cytochrome c biogenesis protein CcsA [Solirubrobacteraceae bacterium]